MNYRHIAYVSACQRYRGCAQIKRMPFAWLEEFLFEVEKLYENLACMVARTH